MSEIVLSKNYKSSKNILLTGGSGFLGSLFKKKAENGNHKIHVYNDDIRGIHNFSQQFDTVVHLASITGNQKFENDLADSFSINVAGTQSVIEYCKKFKAKCIFASTSAVYASSDSPILESSKIDPLRPYALSKYLGEQLCEIAYLSSNVPVTILRFFNLYGIGQNVDYIIPYIFSELGGGRTLQLKMPNAVRDFLFIDDAVSALESAVNIDKTGLGIYNIGSGIPASILEISQMIGEIVDNDMNFKSISSSDMEMDAAVADISLAANELNWEPKVFLDEGLKLIWNYIQAGMAV